MISQTAYSGSPCIIKKLQKYSFADLFIKETIRNNYSNTKIAIIQKNTFKNRKRIHFQYP